MRPTAAAAVTAQSRTTDAPRLYREMVRIRLVEEEIVRRYGEEKMRCPRTPVDWSGGYRVRNQLPRSVAD